MSESMSENIARIHCSCMSRLSHCAPTVDLSLSRWSPRLCVPGRFLDEVLLTGLVVVCYRLQSHLFVSLCDHA